MRNEYRKSLREYAVMKGRYNELFSQWSRGELAPEEELITFLFELDKSWPIMFAIEQRQEFREMARYVANWIDGLRTDSGRKSIYADSYIGILGQEVERDGLIGKILDDGVHEGKPVLDLDAVEKMADAVEKINPPLN